ncbi:MAG: phenylalanine--tRNA ligase subunit beta, partial [Candidatus Aminicenantales bacterium]
AASSILKGVYEAGGEYLKHVSFYDVYKGKQIEEGKKSITLHLSFQSLKRTLTDVEVDSLFEKIVKSLEKSIGSKLRPK